MTDPTTPESKPVVVQADIDRANAFWNLQIGKIISGGTSAFADTDGPIEQNDLVQAFARHRIEASSEAQAVLPGEIGGLVKRLRTGVLIIGEGPGLQPLIDVVTANQAMRRAADTITNLQATVSRLEGALRDIANHSRSDGMDSVVVEILQRMARAALTPTTKEGQDQ